MAAEAWFELAGAAVGGLPAAIKAVLDWRTAKTDRDEARHEKVRDRHREQIATWRAGLADAAEQHQLWERDPAVMRGSNTRTHYVGIAPDPPNAFASAWFQSLRPSLAPRWRAVTEVICDTSTVRELGDEIAAIEKVLVYGDF